MKKSFLPLATTSLILSAFLAQGEQVQAEEQPTAEYATTDKLAESSPTPELAGPVDVVPTRPESAPTRTEAAPSEDASSNAADDRHQAYRKEQDRKVIEEYEKLVETPVEVEISNTNESIKMAPKDENEEVIYKQTYTGKAVIPKGEHIPTLDLNISLDAPVILQSFVNLDQDKAKADGLAAIKEFRSIVWDMEANSELIGEQINPKTGERVEGLWINGERLRDRLKTEGISTKEEYVNRVSWNSDLENLALLNLAEANGVFRPSEVLDQLSKTTNANEQYSGKVVIAPLDGYYYESYRLKDVFMKQFGLHSLSKHNVNKGEEDSAYTKFLNLVLDPRNQSFTLAADYSHTWKKDNIDLVSIIASKEYRPKDVSINHNGIFKILYNQNFIKNSSYDIKDLEPVFDRTFHRINIETRSRRANHRQVHAFKGNNVSLNPDVIQFNEDGSITALKPGTAVLSVNIDGTMKSMKVEVLPSPIVEDKITVWDSEYVNTNYVRNPDMFEGEERVKVEGHPSLRYRLIRDTSSVDGHLLNRELLKDWEIPAIDRIIEVGTKERNIKQPAPTDRPDSKAPGEVAPPGDIIRGRLYEVIPGYFEALPGYHIRLVPETEDQVLRINEHNFKTVIQPRDDLALGEHVIIQDGVNRYTEVTNRIYKDHQNNILKTQEISRQDFPGQDLIIGVGTGKGGVVISGEETPAVKVPAPREPEEKAPTNTKTAHKAPDLRPSQVGEQEGLVAEDRPSLPRKGQTEEEAGADQVAGGLVRTEAPVEGPVDQPGQGEVGPNLVSVLAVSKDSGQRRPGIVEVSASEALAALDVDLVDHLEGQGSRVVDSEESNSAKDQAKNKTAQVTASSQSLVQASSDPSVHSPNISTQLPKTGAQSVQPALRLGLSSLAIGLCLSLRGGKKRRKG
ncbi:G5 domain-containing protein [Aerococcus sp. UMB7834]|uniref:G5 domain-containing protein n=1 Tax=Aerococcus sp. UMB7834 TaxID=3046342 RepID=UPI002551AACA|nr:G5 domain-containing protein [Aerococcus sp. UMB7834]MDK6805106.1 G5 domain-containing protein [Aerococcus sp. UMB7834]